jgi:hypothetical protein
MRVLNQSEHRLLMRLEIERSHHGGTTNGRLIVTHKQFCDYGIDREAISPSIRCLVALKLIEVTKHGRGGNAEYREANEFRLTFRETDQADPTNEWRSIETKEEALRLAVEARRAKNAASVARSVKAEKNKKPRRSHRRFQGGISDAKMSHRRVGTSDLVGRGGISDLLSISRVRNQNSRPAKRASHKAPKQAGRRCQAITSLLLADRCHHGHAQRFCRTVSQRALDRTDG